MLAARPLSAFALLALAFGRSAAGQALPDQPLASAPAQPNVLIVVADDLGVEQLACFGVGSDYPSTPNLDALAAAGVRFGNAWAQSLCSPSRAALLTGRYGVQTGVTDLVHSDLHSGASTDYALPLAEITLPELLEQGTGGRYATGAFGKWHLGNSTVGGPLAPNLAGFSHFDGTYENLHLPQTYYDWIRVVDGAESWISAYATTQTVDSALAWIATVPEPWFAYVAFNAPHDPWHAPPAALHSVDLSAAGPPDLDPRPYYKAAIEAMDTELGRLLASLGDARARTDVIFVGDNGTAWPVALPGYDPTKMKGTPYQGGVHVPLLVAGPAVHTPGQTADALVHVVDIFATAAEMARVPLQGVLPPGTALPSISLGPYLRDPALASLRGIAFTEHAIPSGLTAPSDGRWAVRDGRYKLIRRLGLADELYDLDVDPLEVSNLLLGGLTAQEQASLEALLSALSELLAVYP